MVAEIARPIMLVLCILSLYAVFHSAFLVPASDIEQRIFASLRLLTLAAAIALASGVVFREALPKAVSLLATLPVRIFCWATGSMLVLFLVSWYLEEHCIFYRDTRIWG